MWVLCDYFIYIFLRQDIANGSIKYPYMMILIVPYEIKENEK